MKTAYDNFHMLFQTYFHKFFDLAYKSNLEHLQKEFNVIISFAINIAYASLYRSAYHDKHLCYKLQIRCLSKQALKLFL